jgi:preprotein translocase subunit SecY
MVVQASTPPWKFAAVIAGFVALVYATVFITQLEKRLPLIYYRRRVLVRASHTTPLQQSPWSFCMIQCGTLPSIHH